MNNSSLAKKLFLINMHNKKILDWESPVAYVGIAIFVGGLGVFIYEIENNNA